VLSRTTKFAARIFSSGNVVYKCHANAHQKKRGAARITSFKTSQYFGFLPVFLYDRAADPSGPWTAALRALAADLLACWDIGRGLGGAAISSSKLLLLQEATGN
jgi:hypothetical protein